MTAWRVNQIIEAGGVSLKLIAAGHTQLPLNSSQAYAMSKLDDKRLVAYPPEPTKLLKPNYVKLSPVNN